MNHQLLLVDVATLATDSSKEDLVRNSSKEDLVKKFFA